MVPGTQAGLHISFWLLTGPYDCGKPISCGHTQITRASSRFQGLHVNCWFFSLEAVSSSWHCVVSQLSIAKHLVGCFLREIMRCEVAQQRRPSRGVLCREQGIRFVQTQCWPCSPPTFQHFSCGLRLSGRQPDPALSHTQTASGLHPH